MQGSVSDQGQLPPTNNNAGDAYLNQDDDSLWIWDGTQWVSGGSIQGPQGPQGVQGIGFQGFDGPQGFQGFQGAIGSQGFQGFDGPQGFQGFQGDTGVQGFQGDAGFQGFTGDQGSDGDQGFQGFKGDQGNAGDQGFQGFKGDQGERGFQGFKGDQGDAGNQGFQGFKGDQGAKGDQGERGFQGFTGDQGIGFQGFQGFKGDQGDQGTSNVIEYVSLVVIPASEECSTWVTNGHAWRDAFVVIPQHYVGGKIVGINASYGDQWPDQLNQFDVQIRNTSNGIADSATYSHPGGSRSGGSALDMDILSAGFTINLNEKAGANYGEAKGYTITLKIQL